MSCDYCEHGKNLIQNVYPVIKIESVSDANRIFYSDGYRRASTEQIRFCPMCGEKFPIDPPDSFENIKDDIMLSACAYAYKRGFRAGDGRFADCANCEWSNGSCGGAMKNDLARRIGDLLDEKDERWKIA